MKIWISGAGYGSGRVVDAREARLPALDHGITVGDGVFETVKAVGGQAFALTRHLQRLARSARGLGLGELDLDHLRDGVHQALAANPDTDPGRVRITVTAGLGPLGSERTGGELTAMVAVGPFAQPAPTTDVVVVPWTRNENGALSGLKTTSYAENVRALAYARQRGAGEAIFANTVGNLCEGTGSNIFVVLDGRLVTPPLSAGPLAGITRELVLEWVGGAEEDIPMAALSRVSEAFLTSTGRDVQPIRAIDDRVLPAAPGPVTAEAMKVFAERSAAEIDP
ncbi:aminodeoxychorismate lyase [Thermobifida fusca]|jgi:branched-chain amino acid aminotransferase|uniref:Putative aminotransferase n=2 Tax=Thermobifida fusca TaxID=2021 RepID=Q47N24_THEFY|nr:MULTISPECIES: aminotransferase class IV [Thermobifida]AAZ56145.1 putative aminotransferase [Thermobifida fusca YX]MBO2530218.1 4-amino-4-deoxychorismate lyase [Thermobifida sp.]MDD6792134.1 aminotransferase class IV [Thermobifida fusca]PPS94340.1 class IV aminotransferase [Thermobifida fusca]PZN63926.1 MAG: 4-amino-4-deoxychorismate lyase [Thermobifida fusca]